ncbi:outer membrane beta-barrel protein [Helicobacter cappadocius]|uniref:Outer membrane beta-barrel protein n=1 Tax=Helicobacter cappadocius TaxID=3063998 RepID=A0AA90PJN4_9HELI|nr:MULTISPECIES: outer membrane beta-barrel protein [unclassified Helicobacter]MDO7252522.1 outer membrane beta-barrel protein [Helicobacter sp. faydin-H75]MDP2538389.1 outer membrane beta-barrel protein [Helicobacter sp. faydin-H76]
MNKIKTIVLMLVFFHILCAQDISNSSDNSISTTSQEIEKSKNEGYGVAEIREKQRLIRKKSGKYIGIGIGIFEVKKKYNQQTLESIPAMLSLKTGSQTFFNKNIGIRGFFGLDMASGFVNYKLAPDHSNSFFAMISLGIDVIAEFPLSQSYKHFLGGFAGLGGGALIYADNQNFKLIKDSIYTAGIIIEAGITLDIFVKHRIEFGVKVLPTAKSLLNNGNFQTSLMPYVMYNYKF